MQSIVPGRSKIGWIGTGVMGAPMAGHVCRAGFALNVFSRTAAKATPLCSQGAVWVDSAAEAARGADVVVTMLGYPADVRSVYFGPNGILAHVKPGAVVIDMTTSEPALAAEIYAAAREKSVCALDAPVSGGDIGARNATLTIMAGGDREAFTAVTELWQSLGKNFVYQGPAGTGQHTKLVNQTLIAGGMVALCEALLYAQRAGLNLESVIAAVAGGAAGSWSLSNYGPRILRGDFAPGFFVDHFVKDMDIALAEAQRMRLAVPGLALAKQLYAALQAQGHGRLGTHSLQLALARLNGMDWQTHA